MTVAAERIETHGIVLPPIAPRPESNSSDEYDTDMELEGMADFNQTLFY